MDHYLHKEYFLLIQKIENKNMAGLKWFNTPILTQFNQFFAGSRPTSTSSDVFSPSFGSVTRQVPGLTSCTTQPDFKNYGSTFEG